MFRKDSLPYIFTFMALMITIILALAYTGGEKKLDGYATVKVEAGDNLWTLADRMQDLHGLSKTDFVQWVQDNNHLTTAVIHPGESVIIPVKKESLSETKNIALDKQVLKD
ncbi:LysM peptidoglycan-binding domain-containing protein [Metabacillus sp. GX 13764]|uniref:cell division suppressor protein YneA n=1 Tax=Metabacillus kandeliae TaxID=2900151 RepID=UPI001E6006B4|nr:LysM peptidoglycan-binding domain-containing protein [Metabacillus kandeliae]MCD7033668.1 LysM peptidoglycan-binding domain-containing protein [Metabacillus kandeliae]